MSQADPAPTAAEPAAEESRAPSMALAMFLISVAVLALQVLQTRILSVQMWHHHSYMVVTMTLLGFAAAGSIVTVWPALVRRAAESVAWCGTLFGVSTILGYLLLTQTADRAAEMTARGQYLDLSLFYSYLLFPYLFGGLVVTLILSATREVHRLYFVNLIGSAVGAWVFIATITEVGAERLLVLCALAGPVAALGVLRRRAAPGPGGQPAKAARIGAWVALAACGVLLVGGDKLLRIEVSSTKSQSYVLEKVPGARFLESFWTPLCRLDLVEIPVAGSERGQINIYQDGDAVTVMHSDASWQKVSPLALNMLAYVPHVVGRGGGDPAGGDGPSALVIGVGGGIDIRFALANGASRVLGVEINEKTVDLVGREYAEHNGHVYQRPGVEVVAGEGRSTLRRLDEKFDVIELSGTDTYAAGNSGAYVLSESYLYTAGALREYLEHLSPRGTLGILRLAYDPPRENLRLFAIALSEMRAMGIAKPRDHAVVIYSEVYNEIAKMTVRFACCVFSQQPFAPEVIDLYRRIEEAPEFRVAYYPGMAQENAFTRLARAIEDGTEEEFYAGYPWEVRPVTDDSPFFFNFFRISSLWRDRGDEQEEAEWYGLAGGAVGIEMLGALLLQTSLLVAALVLLPLLVLRGSGLGAPNAWRHLIYFLALGAGFMFLEISTIQRLVLFLGHPTYSLTVTLCCFLFFAGLGSLFSRRLRHRPARALRIVVVLLAVGILALTFGLDLVLDSLLAESLGTRVAAAVAVLAPLNFLMGMPFPIGLARLKELAPQLVPWALGANGGASVVASILCIVVAMESGFRMVAVLAAVIYLLGAFVVTSGPLAAPGRGAAG